MNFTVPNSNSCSPHLPYEVPLAYGKIITIFSAIGLFFSLLLVVVNAFSPKNRSIPRHIITMTSLADGICSGLALYENKASMKGNAWCALEGLVSDSIFASSLLWSTCLIVFIFQNVFSVGNLRFRKLKLILYHIVSWGVPMLLGIIGLLARGAQYQDNYIFNGGCSIKMDFREATTSCGANQCIPTLASYIWTLATVWMVSIFAIVLTYVLFIAVAIKMVTLLVSLRKLSKRFPANYSLREDYHVVWISFRTNLRLSVLSILYTLVWLPSWIKIMYQMQCGPFAAGGRQFSVVLDVFFKLSPSIQAIGNFVLYGIFSETFRQSVVILFSTICRCRNINTDDVQENSRRPITVVESSDDFSEFGLFSVPQSSTENLRFK